MRNWMWTLAGMLACAASLHAQTPATPTTLESHLNQWEQKMKAVGSLVGPCIRTEEDKVFRTTNVYEGTIQFLKPNMTILELKNKKKPEQIEKYIWNQAHLYDYLEETRTILVHELPYIWWLMPICDCFLDLLFGRDVEELRKRYDWKLSKETPEYVYLDIVPRLPADKSVFARAQVVLAKGTYLTRRLWYEQPNGNETTWELPKTEPNTRLNRALFTAPQAPPGWTLERLPRMNK